VPAIAERFPGKVLEYLERSNNEIYALLEDVPRYLALGVTTLKIQGREYPAPLIAELTRIYRRLVDETMAGAADLGAARAALDPVLAERDRWRTAKTSALHERLLVRMEDRTSSTDPVPGTDWDPAPEEARLRRAEARS
jgi:collagenase-like PrtC family protease